MTFEEFIAEWNDEKDFIKVCTSGSTGIPKEIKLDKNCVRSSAERTNSFFGLSKTSRFHSCVSPDYIGGKMMAVRAAIVKGKLTWETPSNNILSELGINENIDLLAVVPSQMISLMGKLEKKERLPKIKNIIIGGSPIHPDLRKEIEESGLNAYETYGMTETASHIALRKVSYEEIPFKVFSGIKVSLNKQGCLNIKFPDGEEIRTKDLAELISEDEFFIKGRVDDIIISGGKKIHPLELEKKLSHLISGNYYFKGIPDVKWGEKLVLIIEGKESDFNQTDLRKRMETILEKWQLQKKILFRDKLARTPNGKIIRK